MVSIAFALYLFSSPGLEWTEAFRDLGYYGAVDGALALILAAVMAGERTTTRALLVAVTAVDGLLRVGLAVGIWLSPGLPYVALTSVLFFATLAVCASVVGVAWGVLALRSDASAPGIATVARWPLALGSVASLLFGVAMFFAGPGFNRRVLLASYALALGVALLAAAGHHAQQLRQRTNIA